MNRINNQDLLTQSQILNNAKNDQTLRTPGNTATAGSLDNTTLTPAWSLLRSAHWTLKIDRKMKREFTKKPIIDFKTRRRRRLTDMETTVQREQEPNEEHHQMTGMLVVWRGEQVLQEGGTKTGGRGGGASLRGRLHNE